MCSNSWTTKIKCSVSNVKSNCLIISLQDWVKYIKNNTTDQMYYLITRAATWRRGRKTFKPWSTKKNLTNWVAHHRMLRIKLWAPSKEATLCQLLNLKTIIMENSLGLLNSVISWRAVSDVLGLRMTTNSILEVIRETKAFINRETIYQRNPFQHLIRMI